MRAGALRMAFVWTALAAGAIAQSASADVIVQNFSFEADVLPPGGATTNSIIDWVVNSANGNAGAAHPPAGFFTSIPNGVNVAFVQGGVVSQPLLTDALVPAVLSLGDTYTLTIDLAQGPGLGTFEGYQLQIFAGSTLLAEKSFSAEDSPAGPQNFFTETLSYTTSGVDAGLVGQQLSISIGPTLPLGTTYFDNVRFSAVPEPSSIALLGVGVAVGAGSAWRRRRRAS